MRLLRWKTEYKTGLAQVDRRHRAFLARINRLHDALDEGEFGNTGIFFQSLHTVVEKHFAREEASMPTGSPPAFIRHKQDHQRLLEEIRDLAASFENSEEIDSVELSARIEVWCTRHFRTHDANGQCELSAAANKRE